MVRAARLLTSFRRDLTDLRIAPASPRMHALGRVVRELMAALDLPLAGDLESPLPERQDAIVEEAEGRHLVSAYARRVKGHGLLLWYRPRGPSRVDIVAVTRTQR